MNPVEKKEAVYAYLREEFPRCEVMEWPDSGYSGVAIEIRCGDKAHYAVIAEDFLVGHRASEIGPTLAEFLLSEHLRELGATPVLVTASGLSL